MPEGQGRDVAPLWQRLRTAPRLAEPEAANRRLADFSSTLDDRALLGIIRQPRVQALLVGIADHSPFLWQLVAADAARVRAVLEDDPAARLGRILAALTTGGDDEPEAEVMRRLRRARQEIALLVAFADLGGAWALEEVVHALSDAADALIATALRHLLRGADARGLIRLPDHGDPETGCGVAVLGLGKLGGRELNYSSDVDLMVVFDRASPSIVDPDAAATLFVRLVRDLVRLLQQPTADGIVLRVDLRLRPDPGSTAVAVGLEAAFQYYESVGQTWERAALIKARAIAGDSVLGQTFRSGLAPFVWRRYFDYAAIADIHAMKRQIHAAKGHSVIKVAGHNVKLGRGGIREIEFFVQTQQLIFGGKRPELRGGQTLSMLRQLRQDGWIGARAVADLSRAYDFLRRVEHRLQMIADAQTHVLPKVPDDLERFARFCGFATTARFSAVLIRHLRQVEHHYALLFESAPHLHDTGGALVFTGVDDDPATIETLARLGYRCPATVLRLVREWHSGQRLAVRSARARESLTELIPKLLVTFAVVLDPDGAVASFDASLKHMPAAGELFAILAGNAALRDLFGDVLGNAPRLAAALTLHPHLLDGAVDAPDICLDEDQLEARAAAVLSRAETTEAFLDALRDFQHEEHFLIGVALLAGRLPVEDAGLAYSVLAVGLVRAALRHTREAFAEDHGCVPGAELAVLAMGKLGSREMTATSDLDLVLLYDFDPDCPTSDGARSLHATQYFTRLTQRLVSHLTVATRRGRLYDVDMRLRPSGRQGPLATKLCAFRLYQRDEAQTWEHMALTRGRIIAGDPGVSARATSEIARILALPRGSQTGVDVRVMRMMIEREKPASSAWDLKLSPGGLIDIEFITQWIVLRHASSQRSLLDPSTSTILRRAGCLGLLEPDAANRLIDAHRLFTNVTQIMRLAIGDEQDPEKAGAGVKRRMMLAAEALDFESLVERLDATRQAVRDIFRRVLSG